MSSAISRFFLLAASVTPVLGFCGAHTHLDRRSEGEEVPVSKFGYTGTIGPLLWTQLDTAANGLCSTGTNQSPINMVDGQFKLVSACDVELNIPDAREGATFENLGSTVEVVMKDVGGTFVLEGKNYTLEQFHFHHPSEHLDDGVSMPMEMHMVFTTEAKEIAVIGVYVDLIDSPTVLQLHLHPRSAPSTLLETVFSSIGDIATPGTSTKTKPLVMSELVTQLKTGSFKRYSGSLTTPPCSEGVAWSVATEKLRLSKTTFQAVRDVVGYNSRYPQNNLGEENLLAMASGAKAPANSTAARRRWAM
ncbi:carbonic anhydrase [Daldinia caldariorum]|uniref:carbonic anhydrase n=1 Tax=Daldinia caldariorum TaxID=326644 RepID=UPI0020074920|nr:carbonic anhydrase [Daldinia caldariorum]KAI1463606.1 carbonic anhydrase [Daldinia caldariorum]